MSATPCLPVAALILAAGSATRMGRLKQLLPYAGRTLVEHAVRQALEAGFAPVIVVIGAEAQALRAALASKHVEIVENENWPLGMGSSLAAGTHHLQTLDTDSAALAVLLADQPLVTAAHLIAMRRLLHTGHAVAVAAQYNGALGVPALFKREMFGRLASLRPEAGARDLLRNQEFDVAAFPLPEAAMDIDTPADFAALEMTATS
ncbi:MAG: nucleotidyltransferase family protein [Acidobacteriaceae bacterium]|nr:nucleotidyltransferase family protein [Acidobacteriaceae bacterium]